MCMMNYLCPGTYPGFLYIVFLTQLRAHAVSQVNDGGADLDRAIG